jgi:hypothetical protein
VFSDDGSRVLKQLNNVTILSDFTESQVVVFDIGTCMEVVKGVDGIIVEASKEHSTKWFGKDLAPKTLEAAYSSAVSADGEINLHKVKGLKVYNHKKEVVDPETLTVNAKCDVIAELYNLTFTKKSFKASWKLVQVKLRPPPKTKYTDTYLFSDNDQAESDSDSDNESF